MKNITKNTVVIETVTEGMAHWEYSVGKNAVLTLVFFISAKKDTEVIPSVHLVGNGSSATVIGIIRGGASAGIHIQTLQHHKAPNTTSNLLVKSVLEDQSICDYKGSIIVDKPAQKTDAYQRNENLLIGVGSSATSSPALEILANDVRCTHGAVVKTLDEQEVWYLASRGIDRNTSRDMIAEGFLQSALTRITDSNVRKRVSEQLGRSAHE